MIDQTISHYRITGRLGAGGMGVVYEAQDLTLGRKVALKFLPPQFAGDQNALDRFLLEARSASALNHPNICTIYAVENGVTESGEKHSFIAMELLEGQSLEQKLYSSALPLDRVLEVSIQLADALDAAHSKGIVHRDIKPGNIFVTQRGQIKILDFGLAKLTRPELQMSTLGPTQDSPEPRNLTSPGATVGTISYMSPEQARGEELDTRSDLFSLGTVMYQMATGKLPFSGTTSAVVFHAILQLDPTPVAQLNPALPPKLQEIVEKLLEKERDLRYQSAADLRGDLKRLKRDTESGRRLPQPSAASTAIAASREAGSAEVVLVPQSAAGSASMPASPTVPPRKRDGKNRWIAWVVLVLVLAPLVRDRIEAFFHHHHQDAPFQNIAVTKVTDTGNVAQVAISPDGKYILTLQQQNGLASLELRNIPTNSATEVQPPADVQYVGLQFSPDGNYFYFVRSDPGNDELKFLYRAPLLGGSPEKLAEDVDSGVSFSPDGTEAAFFRYNNPKAGEYQLVIKNLQSGTENILLSGPEKDRPEYPAWSLDGKVIVFYVAQPQGALTGLDMVDLKTVTRKPFLRSETAVVNRPQWLLDGGLAALSMDDTSNFRRSQVVRISYPDGATSPITRDASNYAGISASRMAPLLAAVASEEHWDLQTMTPGGEPKTVGKASEQFSISWLPDGRLITDKDLRLHILDLVTGAQAAFGSDPRSPEFHQQSCRDGRQVYSRYMPEDKKISIWISDSAGQNQKRLSYGLQDQDARCSPDGHWVYYFDVTSDLLMRLPVEGGGTPQRVSDILLEEIDTVPYDLSPDGTSAIFLNVNHAEGHKELLVEVDVNTGKVRREFTLQKPHTGAIHYSLDGTAAEYVSRENGVDNIWHQPFGGASGHSITSFKSEHISTFQWSLDGKKLALARGHTDSDVVLIGDQPR